METNILQNLSHYSPQNKPQKIENKTNRNHITHLLRSPWSETEGTKSQNNPGDSKYLTLKNMLLTWQWVVEEIKQKNFKKLEMNEGIDTTYQNLWDKVKVVSRWKFISISTQEIRKASGKWANHRELEKH